MKRIALALAVLVGFAGSAYASCGMGCCEVASSCCGADCEQ